MVPPTKRTRIGEKAATGNETRQERRTHTLDQFLIPQQIADNPKAHITTSSPATTQMDQLGKLDEPISERTIEMLEQGIEIVVYRLSLDDGITNHRENWHSRILPRLRSFVEGVYRIRSDDDARKLLLQIVVEEGANGIRDTNLLGHTAS